MAYLDRFADAEAAQIRIAFDERISHPVTFGWGPRFLHSTGQYHKGGPANGVFLQITGATTTDLDVPGKPYSLGTLQLAQALGDLRTLKAHQLPAVRLHLTDRATGLAQLLAAARSGA
jgi:glucose-6-phosphate isomerase